EDLRLASMRNAADADQARRQVEYAQSALTNQLEGRGKVEVAEAEAAAADAARELERARVALDDMKPLFREGFVTRAELDRAEQTWQHAVEQKRVADLRRDALIGFERPAAADRTRAEVVAARDAVHRQSEAAAAQTAQRQAALDIAASRAAEISARI